LAQTPLVKGVWFVTTKRYVLETYDEGMLAAIARAVPEENRGALLDPLPSAWYHEDVFQQALRAVMEVVAHHDPAVFGDFIEACTVLGVNMFFRVMLRITSPAFLMRNMPTMFRQYRRNDWHCEAQADERHAVLTWRGCPYLADRTYRYFLVAVLLKCTELCSGQRPKVDILAHGPDSVTTRVLF
jgi:hypothetical protein